MKYHHFRYIGASKNDLLYSNSSIINHKPGRATNPNKIVALLFTPSVNNLNTSSFNMFYLHIPTTINIVTPNKNKDMLINLNFT